MEDLIYIDKNCKHCGAHFNKGRKDKVFCNRKCRFQYHNSKNRDPLLLGNLTKKRLDHNENILKRLFKQYYPRTKKMSFAILEHEGYDFSLYTQRVQNTATSGNILFIYQFGLEFNQDDKSYWIRVRNNEGKVVL